MKRFLSLIAAGLITFAAVDSFAQSRDIGAQRLMLDDGMGGVLTVEYAGPGNATFVFPPFPSTTVPFGNAPWQTLAWDDVNGEWDLMNNLTNDGMMITATTPITSTVATGTAPFVVASTDLVTNLNADMLDGVHAADLVPITRMINTNSPLTGGGDLSADLTLDIGLGATLVDNAGNVGINLANSNTWTADQYLPSTAPQGDNLIAVVNMGVTMIDAARIGNGLTDTQVNDDLTISGGSVNNSPIGAVTPSTGDFTTLDATTLTLDNPLAIAEGGTGMDASAVTNGQLLIGSAGAFNLATLTGTAGRLTVTNGAGSVTLNIDPTYVGQNTITTLGTIGTGTWQGTAVADTYVADNLTISGGTVNSSPIGATTPSTGAFTTLGASGAVTFSGLAANLPVKTGVGGLLTAAAINLASATEVTGTLPINRGGTNSATALNNGRVMISSGGAIVEAAAGSNGDVLTISGGVPTWAASSSAMQYSPNTTTSSTNTITLTTAQLAANRMIGVNNTGFGAEDLFLQNGSTVGQTILIYGVSGTDGDYDLQNGGNVELAGGADFAINDNDTVLLVWNGSVWMEVSRSNN